VLLKNFKKIFNIKIKKINSYYIFIPSTTQILINDKSINNIYSKI